MVRPLARAFDVGRRPSVSVVIASKDRQTDVLRCIHSIELQTFQPEEIIIVDQSPTPYQLPSNPLLRHIHDLQISGSARARNVGWEQATSDIVFFTDDDAELLPACLEEISSGFRRYPQAVALQCGLLTPEEGSKLQKLHSTLFARGFFDTSPIRHGDTIELRRLGSCAMAVLRNVYDVERFDESLVGYSFGEDWELSQRLRRHGRLFLLPGTLVVHYKSRVGRQKVEQLLRDRWDNYLYFFEKLGAQKVFMNRIWRVWWMLGESLRWARYGLGFPLLGIHTKRTPSRSLSLRRELGTRR